MLPNKSAIDGIPLSSESELFKAKLEQQAARFKEEANAIKRTSKKQKASFTEVIASNAEAISKSKAAKIELARKNIRTNQVVRRLASNIWTSAPRNVESGQFDENCFAEVFVSLRRLTLPPPLDISESVASAKRKWREICCNGRSDITEDIFIKFIFDMADYWVASTSAEEYQVVVNHFLNGLTKESPERSRERTWKNSQFVEFNHFFGSKKRLVVQHENVTAPRLHYLKSALEQFLVDKKILGKSAQERRGNLKPQKVCLHIAKLYQARVVAEKRGFGNSSAELDPTKSLKAELRFDTFVLGWFEQRYGSTRESRSHVSYFVNAVQQYASIANGLEHPRITIFARLVGIPLPCANLEDFFHPAMLRLCMLPALQRLFPSADGGTMDLVATLGDGKETIEVKLKQILNAALPPKSCSRSTFVPSELVARRSAEAKAHIKGGLDIALLHYMPVWRLLCIQYNIRLRKGAVAMRRMIRRRRERQLMKSGMDADRIKELRFLAGDNNLRRDGDAAVRYAAGGGSEVTGDSQLRNRRRMIHGTSLSISKEETSVNKGSIDVTPTGNSASRRQATDTEATERITSDKGSTQEVGELKQIGKKEDILCGNHRHTMDSNPEEEYNLHSLVTVDIFESGIDSVKRGWSVEDQQNLLSFPVRMMKSSKVDDQQKMKEEDIEGNSTILFHAANDDDVTSNLDESDSVGDQNVDVSSPSLRNATAEWEFILGEMGSFQVSRSDISIASLDCPRIDSGTVLSQMVGIENNMIDDLQHELQTHLSAVRRVHIRNTSNGFLESSENRAKLADRLRDQISETRAASKEASSLDDLIARSVQWRIGVEDLQQTKQDLISIKEVKTQKSLNHTEVRTNNVSSRKECTMKSVLTVAEIIDHAKNIESDIRASSERILTSIVGPY